MCVYVFVCDGGEGGDRLRTKENVFHLKAGLDVHVEFQIGIFLIALKQTGLELQSKSYFMNDEWKTSMHRFHVFFCIYHKKKIYHTLRY